MKTSKKIKKAGSEVGREHRDSGVQKDLRKCVKKVAMAKYFIFL